MANEITVKYSDFDVKSLFFTKLEENSRSKGQLIAYPRYKNNKTGTEGDIIIQSPFIHIDNYGVPQEGEYYETDAKRSHLRVPLDSSKPEIEQFIEKIKQLDDHFSSPETMELMIGKKYKKYKYQPIFREGTEQNNDDDDDNNGTEDKKKNKPPYMKVKLDTTWPENIIKTQVYNSILNPETNKRDRSIVNNIQTINDFANVVRYKSNVRLMFRPMKYWAHNISKKDPLCGIVFKLLKIEVEPPPKVGATSKQVYETDNFIDSDNDDETLPKKFEKQTIFNIPKEEKKVDKSVVKSVDKSVDDSADESDESSDEEVVVSTQQNIVQVESDSDDSSEEEVKPKPKPTKKTVSKGKKA
jgi:hypothetical protein